MNLESIEERHSDLQVEIDRCVKAYSDRERVHLGIAAPSVAKLRSLQAELESEALRAPVASEQDVITIIRIALRICKRCDAEEHDKTTLCGLLNAISEFAQQEVRPKFPHSA